MGVTFAAIFTVVALCGWHLRTRRHPSWPVSGDGRFFVFSAYPMIALAVYWMTGSPTSTGWEWALGNVWGLGAMVSLVYGFNALSCASDRRRVAAYAIETLPDGSAQTHPADR